MTGEPETTPRSGDRCRRRRRHRAPGRRAAIARPAEIITILSVLGVDQLTKQIVRQMLPLHDTLRIIPGFLDFTHVQNTGAAFGLLNAADFPYKPAVMIGIAAIALVAIAAYGAQLGFHERLARFGLSLILGGAFGNLIDRAVVGYVVDFVDVYWATRISGRSTSPTRRSVSAQCSCSST
jgi:signal peptidase II